MATAHRRPSSGERKCSAGICPSHRCCRKQSREQRRRKEGSTRNTVTAAGTAKQSSDGKRRATVSCANRPTLSDAFSSRHRCDRSCRNKRESIVTRTDRITGCRHRRTPHPPSFRFREHPHEHASGGSNAIAAAAYFVDGSAPQRGHARVDDHGDCSRHDWLDRSRVAHRCDALASESHKTKPAARAGAAIEEKSE